jgi:selenide,water dikinase
VGPEDLDLALRDLPIPNDPKVLVGLQTSDDAGVYQLTDELALVQTVDFFTPIVDDPFTFGQIAAANALSDVYAMGGRPLTAMNLVAFPVKTLPPSVLREILLGGLSKTNEAGVALVGGHTVEDSEIKYGLSVTGLVHPRKMLTNAGALPGDELVLTKPLGTGVISTALKGDMASEKAVREMIGQMVSLNRKAAERMLSLGSHGCTDITGFGFIGHALEMATASRVGMEIDSGSIPLLTDAEAYAKLGLIPGGAYSNRDYFSCKVDIRSDLSPVLQDLLYDPQTSGGLLISLPPSQAAVLVETLRREDAIDARIVGRIVPEPKGRILLR